MRLSTFLSIAGTLGLLFGLGFLLAPGPMLVQYGISADPGPIVMSRFFGVALSHLGVLILLARAVEDIGARRALVKAGTIGSAVGLAVALWGQLVGGVNALGWSTVSIYLVLLLGYASFLSSARSGRQL